MKKLRNIFIILMIIGLTACTDWLTILPQNTQPADKFWNSKEDIVSVLGAGYYKLRECSEKLIAWGEVRGAVIYPRNTYTELQDFRIRTNSDAIVNWGPLYQVINMANSVLEYAPEVFGKDETLDRPTLNSYLSEAYFLRALSYFYLVRNWRDVPLILEPYVTDEYGYDIPKSSDTLVMTQIKTDIRTALDMGASREYFNQAWETKGRATKWALYALMADACLWTEDYAEAVNYCDSIIHSTASNRPVFIEDGNNWFEIFYPGNSNESIFELQYSYATYAQTNNFSTGLFGNDNPQYRYTPVYFGMLYSDYLTTDVGTSNRGMYKTFVIDESAESVLESDGYIWKYTGQGLNDNDAVRSNSDANLIIYRVAEIMLIKAEALIMQGENNWGEALELINQIRRRAGVLEYSTNILQEIDEESMLRYVLNERLYELAAEGKRWYDLLRMGKKENYKYRESLLIEPITQVYTGSVVTWIRSVLSDNDAHYLPIWTKELDNNKALVQNPYYEGK